YFVDPDGPGRYSFPVVSLATDPANFFDHETGIYVSGVHESNNNPGRPWHNDGNFKQRGDAWERPIHVEFFEASGTRMLAQDAGVRIHGGATRNFTQKTLRLYARPEYEQETYGDNWFTYPLFPGNPNRRYKRLLLRNSGNDWPLT